MYPCAQDPRPLSPGERSASLPAEALSGLGRTDLRSRSRAVCPMCLAMAAGKSVLLDRVLRCLRYSCALQSGIGRTHSADSQRGHFQAGFDGRSAKRSDRALPLPVTCGRTGTAEAVPVQSNAASAWAGCGSRSAGVNCRAGNQGFATVTREVHNESGGELR